MKWVILKFSINEVEYILTEWFSSLPYFTKRSKLVKAGTYQAQFDISYETIYCLENDCLKLPLHA